MNDGEHMIRAIVTDLDRTLLRNDKTISDFSVATLFECKERGVLLVAATARPARTVIEYDKRLNFDATVTLNGAVVRVRDKKIESFVQKEDVQSIIRKLMSIGDCIISLETSHGLYSNVDIPEWKPIVYNNLLEVPNLDSVFKILVSSERHNLKEILDSFISQNVYYSIANNELFQIMSSCATKWHGIEEVLREYGIEEKDIVYFGDDYDDVEPIKKAGLGIAVSNAIEAVKEKADFIVDSNENDGVAKYIQEIVLKD